LPKIDLHRHLEGSLRPETLWEFHQQQRQAVYPNFDALKSACTVGRDERPGFTPFLARFTALYFRYGRLNELERIGAEAVADAAEDGVIHLELRFNPVFWARRLQENPAGGQSAWLTMPPEPRAAVEAAAETVISGAEDEARRRGISVAFILTLGRHFGVAVNRPAAELLQRPIGKRIAAVDLAGDESVPAAEFRELLAQWRSAGKGVTIHAGEDPRRPARANMIEALDVLGAQRIGHGTRASGDAELIERVASSGVALEMCPSSNFQTHTWTAEADYPLKRFLAAGIRTTINTDNPELSGRITLSGEYEFLADKCGLSFAELRQCTLNAAEAAFIAPAERAALVQRIRDEWK
jgi:adenosine deaminase